MSKKEWEAYKDFIQTQRDQIMHENKVLWRALEKCTCFEKIPKSNVSSYDVNTKTSFNTTFDECVVCMKIYNVKTEKIGPRQGPTKSNQKRRRWFNSAPDHILLLLCDIL